MVRCLTLLALAACRPGTPGGDADGDGFAAVDDCDDDDDDVFPGAPETCDGRDEDCDGEVDEAPSDAPTWYPDDDADGWGDDHRALTACGAPLGAVALGGDCDDAREAAHPGAPEACDGLDDDCDGAVDLPVPADAPAWFPDADGDGWGAPEPAVASCAAPEGHVATGTDCDDGDGAIHPEAVETCDGRDEDCDGAIDEDDDPDPLFFLDADGDGYGERAVLPCEGVPVVGAAGDCDDTEPAVNPGAPEVCENRRDDDCDGTVGSCRWGVNPFDNGDIPPHTARFTCPGCEDPFFGKAIVGGEDFDNDTVLDVLIAGSYEVWSAPVPAAGATVAPRDEPFVELPKYITAMWTGGDFDDNDAADVWVATTYTVSLFQAGTDPARPPVVRLTSSFWGGWSARTADLSGDGKSDLIVGTGPFGSVYLVNGPVVGEHLLTDVADAVITGAVGELGQGVAVLGDATGDGLADFAAGDWPGRVFVFESPTVEVVSTADAIAEISGPHGVFGAILDGDDFNGDGYADLIAGDLYYSDSGAWEGGAVFMFAGPFYGTRSHAFADTTLYGEEQSQLGVLRAVGDLDDDGTAEAVVVHSDVAAGRDIYGNWNGTCIRVVDFPLEGVYDPTDLDGYCSKTISGLPAMTRLGDISRDGYADFGFSATVESPPSAYVVFGTGP